MATEWVRLPARVDAEFRNWNKTFLRHSPSLGASYTDSKYLYIVPDLEYSDHFDSAEHPEGSQICASEELYIPYTGATQGTLSALIHYYIDSSTSASWEEIGYGEGAGEWGLTLYWMDDPQNHRIKYRVVLKGVLAPQYLGRIPSTGIICVFRIFGSGSQQLVEQRLRIVGRARLPFEVRSFVQGQETYEYNFTRSMSEWSGGLNKYHDSVRVRQTDGQTSQSRPLFQENDGLWYGPEGGVTPYFTVTPDNLGPLTITTPVSAFRQSVEWRVYKNSDENYDVASSGPIHIGSTLSIPTNPGTQEHYDFAGWRYRNTDYGATGSITTYPYQTFIISRWVGKNYTIGFIINRQDASLPDGTPVVSLPTKSVQYPGSVTLTELTAPNYRFNGWADPSGKLHKGTYSPSSNVTLTTDFGPFTYTVRFQSYTGSLMATETALYGSAVPVPSRTLSDKFQYKGWRNLSGGEDLGPTVTTYFPDRDTTFIAQYDYVLTLKDSNDNVLFSKRTSFTSESVVLPLPTEAPDVTGFRLVGWNPTRHIPDVRVNNQSSSYSGSLTVTESIGFTVLYAEYASVILNGLTLDAEPFSLNLAGGLGERKTVEVKDTDKSPNSWLGEITWEITDPSGNKFVLPRMLGTLEVRKYSCPYFEFTLDANSNRKATVSALASTSGLSSSYQIAIRGRREEWNPSSAYVYSPANSIDVSQLLAVRFYLTKTLADRYSQEVKVGNVTLHSGNVWYVDDSGGIWKWALSSTPPAGMEIPSGAVYPDNPSRPGYLFAGWVDASGGAVDLNRPPHYSTDCYATWTKAYRPQDRDVVYFQRFNKSGDRIEEQIDMGVVVAFTERCTPSMMESETPTMSSENTFIMDTGVATEIRLEVERKCPVNPDDESEDPEDWSNGKWLETVRGLVDRWQSETDGIKLLYIPRGFKATTILAGRFKRTFGFGENYPMLGYVKDNEGTNEDNLGLVYLQGGHKYKLVGYNGLVSEFTDKLTNDTNRRIAVSMSISLGGMLSNYEEYIPVLGGSK